jgi:hypothetical protein
VWVVTRTFVCAVRGLRSAQDRDEGSLLDGQVEVAQRDGGGVLRENIATELAEADRSTVERLVTGTRLHAKRRADEMAASAEMLEHLGVEPIVADASRDLLRRILAEQTPSA